MNKVKKYIPVIFIVILVVASLVAVRNRYLYYSDYDRSIKVSLASEKDVTDVFKTLSTTNNLVQIDRVAYNLYYQKTNVESVKTEVSEKVKDVEGLTVVYAETFPVTSKIEIFISTLLSYLIIALVFLGTSYVLKTRLLNWSKKTYIYFYGVGALVYITGFVILSGALSVVSLVYKVGNLDLLSYYFLALIISILIWINIYPNNSILEIRTLVLDNHRTNYFRMVQLSIPLLILVGFGMGAAAVVPLVLIELAIITASFCLYSIYKLLNLKNRLTKPNFKRPSFHLPKRKAKIVEVRNPQPPAKKKKDKSKKKKK